jgi:hypothetical protein
LDYGIPRLEAGAVLTGNPSLVQPSPHHLDVGGSVSMRGSDLRMPEPSLDGQKVYSRLKQFHRE